MRTIAIALALTKQPARRKEGQGAPQEPRCGGRRRFEATAAAHHTIESLDMLNHALRVAWPLLALLLVVSPSLGAVLQAQELEWATSAGGSSSDAGSGIATDTLGNSYVTGSFQDTATFGAGEANETSLTTVRSSDMFVAKYAPDGSLLWAMGAGVLYPSGDRTGIVVESKGEGIEVDEHGNSYVTGHFLTIYSVAEPIEHSIIIAKYSSDGTLLWTKSVTNVQLRAGQGAEGRGIATDSQGNSYVAGYFTFRAIFGAGEANQTVLTGPSSPLRSEISGF